MKILIIIIILLAIVGIIVVIDMSLGASAPHTDIYDVVEDRQYNGSPIIYEGGFRQENPPQRNKK